MVAVVVVVRMPADSVCDKTTLRDRFRDELCTSARGTKVHMSKSIFIYCTSVMELSSRGYEELQVVDYF